MMIPETETERLLRILADDGTTKREGDAIDRGRQAIALLRSMPADSPHWRAAVSDLLRACDEGAPK